MSVKHTPRRGAQRRRRRPSEKLDTASRPLAGVRGRRLRAGVLEAGDVAALRAHLGLTQAQLAEALGISLRTLQNWEQHRATPDGSGLALLRIAARHPRIIREMISIGE